MPTPVNLHWKYYVDYFSKPVQTDKPFPNLQVHNQVLFDARATDYRGALLSLQIPDAQMFSLRTTYPGLLVGSGYRHQTGSENELKLGFSFDYTTGLPVIPGSSMKGLLRSAFPGDPVKNPLYGRAEGFIRYLLENEVGFSIANQPADFVTRLEMELFGPLTTKERGAGSVAVAQSDIFYDAIIGLDNGGNAHVGKLFGNDFITPHRNRKNPKMSQFTNPVPIQFLKVLPEVPVLFQFSLREREKQLLGIEDRRKLFEAIIRELGIGAKTRVGYGQLQ